MNAMKGTQSIAFSESPYLVSAGSVAGKKEGEGPLGKYFDIAENLLYSELELVMILHRRMTFSERKPGSLQKEQCRSLRVSWH